MSTSDLAAKRVRLDMILQRSIAPVLLKHTTAHAVNRYMDQLGDLLLDERVTSKNITYLPISQIADLLSFLQAVRGGQSINPEHVTTYHVIYQTLKRALRNQPAFQDVLPRIMVEAYEIDMPQLAQLPAKQMLLHAKLMTRLNLTFQEAHQKLITSPTSLWEDVLGTKR